MSSAHRPTWDPAAARGDNRHVSKNFSARQMPAHTKLKFRAPAQGLVPDPVARDNDEGARRDLKRELEAAERISRNKRRKEQGLEPEEEPQQLAEQSEATQSERRKLVEAAAGLDRDLDGSDDEAGAAARDKGKGRDTSAAPQDGSDDSDSDSDSDSDDEDDTAALLRELEKIKQERAEEKARAEKERAETEQSAREDDIALGNPLLNLENAMKGSAAAAAATGGGSLEFGVKRRWDEDVIFKNQAQGNEAGKKGGFVNDLTRSDFHRALLRRFIR